MLFLEGMRQHWNLGDAPGGFLCTNNGIRSLLRVLSEILGYISYENGTAIDTQKATDIYEDIECLTEPLVESFKGMTTEDYKLFRNRTALKGVSQNSLQMLSLIHNTYPEFNPPKLMAYLETVDEKGTEEAQKLIDEMQHTMHVFVINKLKASFVKDEKEWWYEGIPEKVRLQCTERREKEKGAKEEYQYLLILDYHNIANSNWNLFKPYFAIGKGGKAKQTDWLKKLGKIRNITHHREKWPAEKEQVKMIRMYHKHVVENFR